MDNNVLTELQEFADKLNQKEEDCNNQRRNRYSNIFGIKEKIQKNNEKKSISLLEKIKTKEK